MFFFAKFTFRFAIFSIVCLVIAFILDFFKNSNQSLAHCFLFTSIMSFSSYILSTVLILIYEFLTVKKLKSSDFLENKSYRRILLWRKILAFLNVVLLAAAAFIILIKNEYTTVMMVIPFIAGYSLFYWAGLMSETRSIEMSPKEDSYGNKEKDFSWNVFVWIVSAILIVMIVMASLTFYRYFYQGIIFYRNLYGQNSSYLTSNYGKNLEKALLKKYILGTPLHLSLSHGSMQKTSDLILAVAYEEGGDLLDKVLAAKNAQGKTPEDILLKGWKPIFENKIACMRIGKLIENPEIPDKNIIDKIRKEKINVNTYFPETNKTLLNYAAENYRFELTKYLISQGVPVNNSFFTSLYIDTLTERDFTTSLHIVCRSKSYRDSKGILHESDNTTRYRMAKLLLENGADPNFPATNGITPFMQACRGSDDIKLIKLLVEHKALIHLKNTTGQTPFIMAVIRSKNLDILKFLIDKGADIHSKDSNGFTPFARACGRPKNIDTIKFLVNKKCDINSKSIQGTTPLMMASMWSDDPDTVKFLVNKGATIYVKNMNGDTPFIMACSGEINLDIIKFLYVKGVDINLKNYDGFSPIMLVCMGTDDPRVIKFFIEKGADVHVKSNDGWTILDCLEMNYHKKSKMEILELLLNAGADPYEKGQNGKSFYSNMKKRAKDINDDFAKKTVKYLDNTKK